MKKILIFGASEQAKSTIDVIEREQKHKIGGILDDKLPKNSVFEGYKVLGKIENLKEVSKHSEIHAGIIAIGDNYTRLQVYKRIMELDPKFSFITGIHPSVILGKNVQIGPGSLIMPGVIINNDTKIGMQAYIGNQTSIDHDSIVEDFVSFSPGCITGGAVKIGFCSAICLKAGIIHGISIGQHSVIGAGAIVTKNLGDHVLAYGVPARIIRHRKEDEPYL